MVQAKIRHSEIMNAEATPYACWHGWFGSTNLQTALLAVAQVKEDLVLEEWLKRLVIDSKEIVASAGRALEQAAAERLMVRAAHAHPRKLESGSLVVVERAFFALLLCCGCGVAVPLLASLL